MNKIVGAIVLVFVAGLWFVSSRHAQQSVGGEESTVTAQMTAVAKPTSPAHR